jgi:replicative DNA helicase
LEAQYIVLAHAMAEPAQHLPALERGLFRGHGLALYDAIAHLHAQKATISEESVGNTAGWPALKALLEVCDSPPLPAMAGGDIRRLREARYRETLQGALARMATRAVHEDLDLSEISAEIEAIGRIRARAPDEETAKPYKVQMRELLEYFEKLRAGEIPPAVQTGLCAVDDETGGMQRGELIILGARSGVGKTAFAQAVAHNCAKSQQKVLFCSLEMGSLALMQRAISMQTGLSQREVERRVMAGDFRAIGSAMGALADLPLRLAYRADMGLADLERELQKEPQDLVIIDYLQIMRALPGHTREREIATIAQGLKSLAISHNCAVLALIQLNKGSASRADKITRPSIVDARESEGISFAADQLWLLHRDDAYLPRADWTGEAEIIIAKNRSRGPGLARIAFDAECTRFRDVC